MTHPSKRKGDSAELEAASLLTDLLGFTVRRKLGAGRMDDTGDLYGIPETVVQAAWWPNKGILQAVRHKPEVCEHQRENARVPFAFSMIRLNGGLWRAVLTPEQMATYVRETLSSAPAA